VKPIDLPPHVLAYIALIKLNADTLDATKREANNAENEEAYKNQNPEAMEAVSKAPRRLASRLGLIFCLHGL
jgi:hypothetical protein